MTVGRGRALVDGPWGRAVLIFQIAVFAVPASIAWSSTLNATVYLPLVVLPTTFVVGVVMLAFREWRKVGARVIGATLLAFVLEVVLALTLIAAYSSQSPDWDLS